MSRIGFLVNPYAGMGGAVGLKGTDGCVMEARKRGAIPVSPSRAVRFLSGLIGTNHFFLTVKGNMGEEELLSAGLCRFEVIHNPESSETTDEDTREACRAMVREGIDLLVFCGGDGTARDVFSVIGRDIPMLGIPAGVKIYSGVFALTPESATHLLSGPAMFSYADGEVMDVDEEQYRDGILTTRLTGIARTPFDRNLCQSCKEVSFGDEEESRQGIALFITEIMRDDTLYLLGAGSTTQAIASCYNQPSTLLGVDAYYQKKLIRSDLNEQDILCLLDRYDLVRIVLSPIGAQGFILGRGNQQISSRVLNRIGTDAVIVVATPEKLRKTPVLFIDTGDYELNNLFPDTIQVICGYRLAQRIRVESPGFSPSKKEKC